MQRFQGRPLKPSPYLLVGAGLTLAHALLSSSKPPAEVVVFERSSELKPNVGGGVQINGGAAVLCRLGFGPDLAAR